MTPTPETASPTPPAAATRRVQEIFLGEGVPESGTENLVVNLGPSHPAMHGIVRIVTELDVPGDEEIWVTQLRYAKADDLAKKFSTTENLSKG